jgi:hypothetical protein
MAADGRVHPLFAARRSLFAREVNTSTTHLPEIAEHCLTLACTSVAPFIHELGQSPLRPTLERFSMEWN